MKKLQQLETYLSHLIQSVINHRVLNQLNIWDFDFFSNQQPLISNKDLNNFLNIKQKLQIRKKTIILGIYLSRKNTTSAPQFLFEEFQFTYKPFQKPWKNFLLDLTSMSKSLLLLLLVSPSNNFLIASKNDFYISYKVRFNEAPSQTLIFNVVKNTDQILFKYGSRESYNQIIKEMENEEIQSKIKNRQRLQSDDIQVSNLTTNTSEKSLGQNSSQNKTNHKRNKTVYSIYSIQEDVTFVTNIDGISVKIENQQDSSMIFQDLIILEEEKDAMDFQILDIYLDNAIDKANKCLQKVQNELNNKWYLNNAIQEINEINFFFAQ